MSWRSVASRVIGDIIVANPDDDEKTLRKKISAAYPFGERRYHPYKIWLSEVKKQIGKRFLQDELHDLPLQLEWPEWLQPKGELK